MPKANLSSVRRLDCRHQNLGQCVPHATLRSQRATIQMHQLGIQHAESKSIERTASRLQAPKLRPMRATRDTLRSQSATIQMHQLGIQHVANKSIKRSRSRLQTPKLRPMRAAIQRIVAGKSFEHARFRLQTPKLRPMRAVHMHRLGNRIAPASH